MALNGYFSEQETYDMEWYTAQVHVHVLLHTCIV